MAPALAVLERRHRGASLELMARAELARFAAGRIAGIARGHSIDRVEVSALFRETGPGSDDARGFFGQFAHIHSFFAAEDARMRRALGQAAGGPVSFYPFRPDGDGHIAAEYLRSIDAAGQPLEVPIDLLPSDLEEAERALREAQAQPGRYVLIFPGSGSPAKSWPAENFARLADAIAPVQSALVVLGPAEEEIAQAFAGRRAHVLTERELGAVAALARMAAAFVGNDSGVSHLAAAAGARGVVMFGPTDPARWRPIGAVTVIRREPIDQIEVSEVAGALESIVSDQ
ncbi:MAG TPA: glycosyltransferase family 9 protein [Candidatus Binataceae bacterium]|nr:glycosyltransferase family 9 protein [Candidatus Binataceae bacterium]